MDKNFIDELKKEWYSFEEIQKIDESINQANNNELYDFYEVYKSVLNNSGELCTK